MNLLFYINLQSVFDECVREPGTNDIICELTVRNLIGIVCLFEPATTPEVIVGRSAVQNVPDNLANSARNPISPAGVSLVARHSLDAFQQFPEKPVFWEILDEIGSRSIDFDPRFVLGV